MKRRSLLLAGPALMAGGFTGLSVAGAAAAQTHVIKFGQSASLSGNQANYGKDIRAGMLAAFAAASKADAAKGFRYELVTLDDGGLKSRCASNVSALINDGVSAIVGLTSGAGAEACLTTIQDSQIALLGTASGNMGIRKSAAGSVYHVRAGYDLEYQRMANYVRDFGMRRVGVVTLQDTSQANQVALSEALGAMNIKPKEVFSVDRNAQSFTDVGNALLAANVDCVLFATNATPVSAIIDQMVSAKYAGMFYASSFAGQELIDVLVARKQSTVMSTVVPRTSAMGLTVVNRAQQDLLASGLDARLGLTTLEGYIAGRIAVEAARQAIRAGGDRPSRARMRESVAGLRADLGGYKVDFAAGSSQGSNFVELVSVDRYGKLVG